MDAPPPVTVVNERSRSPYLLVCEHASNFIPAHYKNLGLPESELTRHIAWDIGANAVALELSRLIDAPLVHSNYSRLIVDLNRPLTSLTLIPETSEVTSIPGNLALDRQERQARIDALFTPFQDRIATLLDAREVTGPRTSIIAIHSFTPVFKGVSRPWRLGVLYRRSKQMGEALIAALGGQASGVVANQPYQIEDDGDYTIPIHGEARGLDALLLEIRQDLITTETDAHARARALASAFEDMRF